MSSKCPNCGYEIDERPFTKQQIAQMSADEYEANSGKIFEQIENNLIR